MIPDPSAETPSRDGTGGPAGLPPVARPGQTCWLCGQPVTDPPRITGQIQHGRSRLAHRTCMQTLGALDLNLPFPPSADR